MVHSLTVKTPNWQESRLRQVLDRPWSVRQSMPRQEFEAWACVAEQATACFARLLLFFSSWYHHVLKKDAGQRPEGTDDEDDGLGQMWGSEADQDEINNNDGSITSESVSVDDLPGMSPGLSDLDDSEAEKAAGIEGGGSGIMGYSLFSADKVARSGHESTYDWMMCATKGERAMEFSQHEHSHLKKSKVDGPRPPKRMSLTATLSALLQAEENRMGRGQYAEHHDAPFKARPARTVWSREPMHLGPINIQDSGRDGLPCAGGGVGIRGTVDLDSRGPSSLSARSTEISDTKRCHTSAR
jgi:hypothetical protein